MGKKKNKKNQKNRNGDIQQKIEATQREKNEDKEQRRTTRLVAIVAIIVAVGTVYTILLNMTRGVINVWPQKGIIYWYMQILSLFILSMGVLIFWDILVYVYYDLKRYNVLIDDYTRYDTLSDEKYSYLLNDFKLYLIMNFIVDVMIIPVSAICGDISQIVPSVIILVPGIVLGAYWIKKQSKGERKKNAKRILYCTAKCIIVSVLCYVVIASDITTSESAIEVMYNEEDGGKTVQGVMLGSELLYWTYRLNLRQEVEKNGCYYIKIIVHQGGKKLELINSFILRNDKFIYAKEYITKDY